MKDKRPVNLDIGTIRLPLAAITSITHRASGVVLFIGVALLLRLFQLSLSGPEAFDTLGGYLQSGAARFTIWVVLSALAYHMVAGIKHLFLDFGIGESREGGPLGAKITLVASAVLIILLGVWLW